MPLDRRVEAVAALIRLGWSPPRPNREQALRLLEDISKAGQWGQTLELSPAELRLAHLLANGETVVDAAKKMGLSPHSTRSTAKSIRRRLGVRTMTHAIALLVDEGVVEVVRAEAPRPLRRVG